MNEIVKKAKQIINKINERSLQRYELIAEHTNVINLKSWSLYVEDLHGNNRCKIADGNYLLIARLINTLAEIHDIADSRVY
jgi:hypothetical protein